MGISTQQAQALMKKQGKVLPGPKTNCRKAVKGMNKLEEDFSRELETWKASGDILEYFYEHLKLRLAHNTFYSPDFLVITPEEFQVYEVKGFWEDDARVKIKWAARLYWFFRFFSVEKGKKKDRKIWNIKEVE